MDESIMTGLGLARRRGGALWRPVVPWGRGYFVLEPSLTEVGFLDSRGVSEMRLLEGGTAWLRLRPYLVYLVRTARHVPPASSIT